MPRKTAVQKKETTPLTKALKAIDNLPPTKKTKSPTIKALMDYRYPEKVKEPRVFEYKRLSASMMKTWLSCKRKFHLHYIEGIPQETTQPLSLGTACHEALEQANLYLQKVKRPLNPVESEFYIQIFRDTLAQSYVKDHDAFEEGESIVQRELISSSREEIVGVEEEFDLVTPEGVRIYGFIDKLVIDKASPNTLRIIDYKTSVMPMSYEEAKIDEQLAMYDLAMSIKYPQYENRILELRYIRTNDSITIYKQTIEQQNFRRRLLAVDKAIKAYMSNLKEIPPGELNQFCNWCSYKSGCPLYAQHMTMLLPSFPNIDALDDTSFLEMWIKSSAIESSAKAWKESLKLWAMQRLEAFPENPIDNGEKQIYTVSTARREYDPVQVGKIIGLKDLLGDSTNGEPLVKITNKHLDQYLSNKNDPKLQAKLESAVTVKFNSPQIRMKKS